MAKYTYLVENINGGVDVTRLLEEIAKNYKVNGVYLSNDGSEVTVESEATQEQINTIVSAHEGPDSLMCYKAAKFIKINERTSELISNGFQYAGKMFSLSMAAQAKMMGVHQVCGDPMLTYPIKWNTKDDNDYYDVVDSDEMHLFYMAGVGTCKACVDSGTALKDLVRAATSKAEVDAIVDPR